MKYTINTALIPRLNEKVKKFEKKLKKYGDDALVYTIGEKRFEKYHGKIESVVDVEISGGYRVNGYEFVASLEFDGANNIVRKFASDANIPTEYRSRCQCDHCKTNRYRKYTVLLKKDDEYVQVGKSCVTDYLGVQIESYASYLSIFESLADYIDSMNKNFVGVKDYGYSTEEVVGETLEYVSRRGYISKSKAYEDECDSTSTMVWHALNGDLDIHGNFYYKPIEISEENKAKAKEVIEYCKSLRESELDYEYNLSLLACDDCVEAKNFGLVVSMVATYNKHINSDKEKQSDRKASEYIGNIGEKIQFTATPVCVTSYETEYGVTNIYKFDVDGNDVIWKTGKFLENVEMKVSGTIKDLNKYNGRKQTVVTRCKTTVCFH